ncbi:MAG: hypothetical protein OEW08_07510 [Gammaproteobacteria bacterium]|nr:hypothetical protein [Gammaproteobacteria bacterium]
MRGVHQFANRLAVVFFICVWWIAGCGSGGGTSTADTEISAQPPVLAGNIYRVAVGQPLVFAPHAASSGAGMHWTMESRPAQSRATLQAETTANPQFTPDIPGTYVLQMTQLAVDKTKSRVLTSIEAVDDVHAAPKFNHNRLKSTCIECHDGANVPGKPTTHMLSSNECVMCHSSEHWTPVLKVAHDGVIGLCDACHNGTVASGKSPTHRATVQQCNACHMSGAWRPAVAIPTAGNPTPGTFDHATVTQTCIACHNNVVARGLAPMHIQTTQNCQACHSTQNWRVTGKPDHREILSNCERCHAPSSNHLAVGVNAGCERCHVAVGVWTTLLPGAQLPTAPVSASHPVTTEPCASCHNGVVARGQGPAHVATSQMCAACHSVNAWLPIRLMDHREVLEGCAACHTFPAAHLPAAANCDACHSPLLPWLAGVKMNHGYVLTDCADCHNGISARGVSVNHVPFTGKCGSCHTDTQQWVIPSLKPDHLQLSETCSACHNGVRASGKNPSHIMASDACASCHGTVVWRPVIRVDHAQVLGRCDYCHNAVVASGKSLAHIATTSECGACHSTSSWSAILHVDHLQVIGRCESCHNGVITIGKPVGHKKTRSTCSKCHGTLSWKPLRD